MASDTANLPNSEKITSALLQILASSVSINTDSSTKTVSQTPNKATSGYISFTKKEISTMPKSLQRIFVYKNQTIKYRYVNGVFQARYRKDGISIEVASKDFETMKQKFIQQFSASVKPEVKEISAPAQVEVLFADYAREWLKLKEKTTKPSTYKEYARLLERNLLPTFGSNSLSSIARNTIQQYLLEFVDAGKNKTADKLKLQLNCIFNMAEDDFKIPSPMKKIVLPFYESKKGSALNKEEESKLVNYCIKRNDDVGSAFLVLLYFGLRQSELSSIQVVDDCFLQCETSKERMGRNVVLRKIPFTLVMKRCIQYIDFDKAKNANSYAIKSAFKRQFPEHHLHELRYTFITRCKECGVNPEVVMLWDGHSSDKDVKSSVVDRGYTDYSKEYLLSQAELVYYRLN